MSRSFLALIHLTILIVLFGPPNSVLAQEVGDRVIAKSEVTLRLSKKIVETVARDTVLEVEKTNGQWLWVKSPSGKKGWVKSNEVVEAPPDLPPGTPDDSQQNGEQEKTVAGSGTAFVIHSDGYLITNAHVVRNQDKGVFEVEDSLITVTLKEKQYSAELRAIDQVHDLALLKINVKGLTAIPLGDSDKLKLNENVHAFGFPRPSALGGSLKVNPGAVTGIDESRNKGKVIQTSATINKGNSGGPLVNERGEAVGVVVGVWDFEGDVGACIPINYVKDLVKNEPIQFPQSKGKSALDRVELVERLAPSVCFVRMDAVQWSFNIGDEEGRNARIRFTPDGAIAACNKKMFLSIWDPNTPQRLVKINTDPPRPPARLDPVKKRFVVDYDPIYGDVNDVAVASNGNSLAWASSVVMGTVKCWDLKKGKLAWVKVSENRTRFGLSETQVEFSHDGAILASGNEDGLVTLWKTDYGREKHKLRFPGKEMSRTVKEIQFSPNDQLVMATAGTDGTSKIEIRVWNTRNGALRYSIENGGPSCFSADGRKLITCHDDKLHIRDAERGTLVATHEHEQSGVESVFALRRGDVQAVLTSGYDSLFARDLKGKWLARFEFETKSKGYFNLSTVSRDGRNIAVVRSDGWITVFNLDELFRRGALREAVVTEVQKGGGYISGGFVTLPKDADKQSIVRWLRGLNLANPITNLTIEKVDVSSEIWDSISGLTGVTELELNSCNIARGDLANLTRLWKLTDLSLRSTPIDEPDLKHIANLSNLRDLDLYGTKVETAGAQQLASLSKLERLHLSGTSIDDDVVGSLKSRTLVHLDVSNNEITAEGLKHLSNIRNLRSLDLSHNKLTNSAMVHIKTLVNLETLNVAGNSIGDEDLSHLISLTKLKSLTIYNTDITDQGVMALEKLKSLTTLAIPKSISKSALDTLKKALPGCNIFGI